MRRLFYFNLNGKNHDGSGVFSITLNKEYNVSSIDLVSVRTCLDRAGLVNEAQDIMLFGELNSKDGSNATNLVCDTHFISDDHNNVLNYFPCGKITKDGGEVSETFHRIPLVYEENGTQQKFGPNIKITIGEHRVVASGDPITYATTTLNEIITAMESALNNSIELCFEIKLLEDTDGDEDINYTETA